MRKQRPRGSTTREAVVSAALDVIDKDGIDGLTIRSVARLVGAPPMSLYTHFANKQELLDLVDAEVSRRLYAHESSASTWQASLLAFCRHVRTLLIQHPRWIPLLSRPAAPVVVPSREKLLAQMVDDGMSPADAMAALTSATMTAIGLALVDVTLRAPDGEGAMIKRYDRLRDWFESSGGGEQPVTRTAVSKLRRLDADDNFALTLRSLIAGLDASRASSA